MKMLLISVLLLYLAGLAAGENESLNEREMRVDPFNDSSFLKIVLSDSVLLAKKDNTTGQWGVIVVNFAGNVKYFLGDDSGQVKIF